MLCMPAEKSADGLICLSHESGTRWAGRSLRLWRIQRRSALPPCSLHIPPMSALRNTVKPRTDSSIRRRPRTNPPATLSATGSRSSIRGGAEKLPPTTHVEKNRDSTGVIATHKRYGNDQVVTSFAFHTVTSSRPSSDVI